MNLVSLPHPNNYLIVEPLDYPNPYDFSVPHRHDYFEIILIKESGGEQLIDFTKSLLLEHSCYTVYPRQIHLLKRENAQGLILQFRKDIFEFIFPIKHHYLYFSNPELKLGKQKFEHLYSIAQGIMALSSQPQLSSLSIYKSYSYLQIILITLIELHRSESQSEYGNFGGRFLELLSQSIREKRKVADYAEMLAVSPDRLTSLCKETLGATPLKLIHEELLLEIKRLMVLGNLSLKEIAFELNFENTANFSSFVKSATGMTPSELQELLRNTMR